MIEGGGNWSSNKVMFIEMVQVVNIKSDWHRENLRFTVDEGFPFFEKI